MSSAACEEDMEVDCPGVVQIQPGPTDSRSQMAAFLNEKENLLRALDEANKELQKENEAKMEWERERKGLEENISELKELKKMQQDEHLKKEEDMRRDLLKAKKETEEEKEKHKQAKLNWKKERKEMMEEITKLNESMKSGQEDLYQAVDDAKMKSEDEDESDKKVIDQLREQKAMREEIIKLREESQKKQDDLERDLFKAKKETDEEREKHKKAKLNWKEEKREMMEEITKLKESMKSGQEDLYQAVDDAKMKSEDEDESDKKVIDQQREQKAMREEIIKLREESQKKQDDLVRDLRKAKKETDEEKEKHKKATSHWEREKNEMMEEISNLKDLLRKEGKHKAGMSSPQDKVKVRLTLTLKWSEPPLSSKAKLSLEYSLQSWFNINHSKNKPDCSVEKILKDGRAVITIKPAPAVAELQDLNGRTLTQKGKDGPTITILGVSLTEPELDEQQSDTAIKTPASQPEPLPVKPQESRSSVPTAVEDECVVPVSIFWYINQIYQEDIKEIEKNNGVEINPEVKLTFRPGNKAGDPKKANSDFTNLVQTHMNETSGSTLPLKFMAPEQWSSALNVLKKKENNLLLTLSSGQITLLGPRKSQDAFRKCLNDDQLNVNLEAFDWPEEDSSLSIKETIKDPLLDTGVILEQSHWMQMKTQFDEKIKSIKAKFEVDVKEFVTGDAKVRVQTTAKRASGKASMESHAIRALLRLYQRAVTSPKSFTQHSVKSLNGVREPEGAFGGFGWKAQPAVPNTGAPSVDGATPADQEDNCPICLGPFTDKQQLKCKHGFCGGCLQNAKESMGPICPVCRAVFGKVEGNQPAGTMTWRRDRFPLPGFSGCDTIVINYYIPSGRQTEKHPNPGKHYFSLNRTAYLPGNKEGEEVLKLLERAFDQKLTFTVGTSRTTGAENQLTWNDIHHKTSTHGGPQSFGYPDPDYLSRVKEELKAKGIF